MKLLQPMGAGQVARIYTEIMDRLGVLRCVAPVSIVAAQLHAQVVEGIVPRGLEDREMAVAVVHRVAMKRVPLDLQDALLVAAPVFRSPEVQEVLKAFCDAVGDLVEEGEDPRG